MSLQQTIETDYKKAFKENDRVVVSALRMLKSALKNREIEFGRDLTDAEVVEVTSRQVKQRRDAAGQYKDGGRLELVQHELDDVAVYSRYLPEQLTDAELKSVVDETVSGMGNASPQDVGKVMAAVMQQVKGRADGAVVKRIVQERLSG